MSFNEYLDKAMDAAKAGNAEEVSALLKAALQAAESEANKAFVQELIEDAEKGNLDEIVEDIEKFLAAAAPLGFQDYLQEALDAAKAGNADKVMDELKEALEVAENEANKAFVQELIEDAEKGNLDEIVEDIEKFLSTAAAPSFNDLLDKAMDAAKAGNADKAKEELQEALDLATSDADKAFVQELIEDVEKGNLDEVVEDIEKFLATATAEQPSAEVIEKGKQLYTQKGCFACHGDKVQGNKGPILAGLPVEHIKTFVRSGKPEAGMPAFDEHTLSDEDLDAIAQFLHSLTLEDTGVELSQPVLTHLEKAWDALQANDKAGVETHLKEALKAAADAPEGVQVTLKDMLEDLEEKDWAEDLGMHLGILLGK